MNVAPFYDGWRIAQERLVERYQRLSSESWRAAAPNLWRSGDHCAHRRVRPYCSAYLQGAWRRAHTVRRIHRYGWEDE